MNQNGLFLLVFGAFAVGAAIGAGLTYSYISSKETEEENSELEEMERYYQDKIDELKQSKCDNAGVSLNKKMAPVENRESLNPYSKLVSGSDVSYVKTEEDTQMPTENDEELYEITEDSYDNSHENYEKLELIYYRGDRTFADDRDQMLNAIDDFNPGMFDWVADMLDELPTINTIFVRCDNCYCDWRIDTVEDSYSEVNGEE